MTWLGSRAAGIVACHFEGLITTDRADADVQTEVV